MKSLLFSSEMIRAVRADAKTMTRRVCTPKFLAKCGHVTETDFAYPADLIPLHPGDVVYCRETWAETDLADGTPVVAYKAGGYIPVGRNENSPDFLITDWEDRDTALAPDKWRPSIHMPEWAAREFLRITAVKVERVQDISDADVRAEGVIADRGDGETWYAGKCQEIFAAAWDRIHGPGSWDANQWVWAYSFARCDRAGNRKDGVR
jgi:hypothetical protein